MDIPKLMKTRNIFIDTSIFISHNYNYRSSVFENIVRLSKTGKADVFVTDITVSETKAHIEADISKALQASSKFKKDARALNNIDESPFNVLFQKIDEVAANEKLKQQLSDFLHEANAKVLSTSEVSIEAVFEKYFHKRPPFGEGKKKSEFPDAFAVEALEAWCEKKNVRMYVASTDPDLKSYCESSDKLLSLDKLAEFINLVESHDEVLAPAIRELIDNNKEIVEDAITESFLEREFWINDQDGDVNEVRVNAHQIADMLLLEVEQESAVVELDISTNISADLTYDDLDTAPYDSEDKVLIPLQTIEKTVEQDIDYTATLYISHDVEDPEFFEIEHVDINTNIFGFSIRSDDEWPYK